jgi:ADP-ribose pyrophosphatase YjhB (NUDIX family)
MKTSTGAQLQNLKKLFSIGQDPERDWRLIVYFFFVTCLALLILSAYIYTKIDQGDFFVAESKEKISTESIDRKALTEAVSLVQEQDQKFKDVDKRLNLFVDPSL